MKDLQLGDLVCIPNFQQHQEVNIQRIESKWYWLCSKYVVPMVAKNVRLPTISAIATNLYTNSVICLKYTETEYSEITKDKLVGIVIGVGKEIHPDFDLIKLASQEGIVRYMRRMELEGPTDD
jgi:hypothetical protein